VRFLFCLCCKDTKALFPWAFERYQVEGYCVNFLRGSSMRTQTIIQKLCENYAVASVVY
jgi:hypothetical protein